MQEGLNYAWRFCSDGEYLLTGTYCSAFREARRRERYDESLAAFDTVSNAEFFVRAGPPPRARGARLRAPHVRFIEDRNRWGRVITRVQLRPPHVKVRRRGKKRRYNTRGETAKYVRQYQPIPNCFDFASRDWV